MYLDYNETLKGQIILIDPFIHNTAKLTKDEFLERVKYVKHLRTSYNSDYISFYITSIDEYNNLMKFHDLVNKGIFDFSYHEVFAVAIQPKLYQWFKSTSITTIQKQIASWMAGAYYFNPDKRHIQKQQVYKPLFEEILNIVDTYYKDYQIPDFVGHSKSLLDNGDNTLFEEQDKCTAKYIQVCKDYCKAEPPEFISSPFDYDRIKEWGVNDYHNFEFVQAYLNENDWDKIVLRGSSHDDMHRVESRDDLWLKWKHVYTTFDQRKNFVYSFYLETNDENEKQSKQRREAISNDVKTKVWQRDNGMCVVCGSKEKLEFDHIIPFSKGGASSFRNLQLLCEPCNRKKHANL
jgi:HNH endonuclease